MFLSRSRSASVKTMAVWGGTRLIDFSSRQTSESRFHFCLENTLCSANTCTFSILFSSRSRSASVKTMGRDKVD